MSNDPQMLRVLSVKIGPDIELRYFEMLRIRNWHSGRGFGKAERVYCCVGRHHIHFVKTSLLGKVRSVDYHNISKIAEDTSNKMDFRIDFKDSRSQDTDSILISSEKRFAFLSYMAICYLADGMDKEGRTIAFPKVEEALKVNPPEMRVLPFSGHQEAECRDYSLFLLKDFKETQAANAKVKSSIFKAPAYALLPVQTATRTAARVGNLARSAAGFAKGTDDYQNDITVSVHTYDPTPLKALEKMGRGHIRWLAMEYKQSHIKNQEAYVVKNQLYLKKMNLTNDVSAWICWELVLKSSHALTAIILLRRQYVPPLMDTAQDFAITFKCPYALIQDGRIKEEALLNQCHLAADSFGPLCNHMTIYEDIIQAKLDALHFDEEGYGWIQGRLRYKPNGATELEKFSLIFLKGILKMLSDENELSTPDLLTQVADRVARLCVNRKSDADLDPMSLVQNNMKIPKEGQINSPGGPATDEKINSWYARVSRYFAFCVDGGLLGARFTLFDIISPIVNDSITQGENKLLEILNFLLHLRPKDLQKPWDSVSDIRAMLTSPQVVDSEFNDRVMQAMLEMDFLARILKGSDSRGMSREYAQLLRNLLRCDASSVNLKAAICRQIIASKDASQALELCPGLVDLLRSGGLFLATYTTAALVNLSQANETVKNYLIKEGIAHVCSQQLRSKDDDLILYTLVLLVHLTKSIHHRLVLKQASILPALSDILSTSSGAYVVKYKRRLLTELCSVIGQMCNDEETRKYVCEQNTVLENLLGVFDAVPEASTLKSKVLFALKQLCANSMENKEAVGSRIIKAVVQDLIKDKNLLHKDWATNAVMFLLMVVVNKSNCLLMKQSNWEEASRKLLASELGAIESVRSRVLQINARVMDRQVGEITQ